MLLENAGVYSFFRQNGAIVFLFQTTKSLKVDELQLFISKILADDPLSKEQKNTLYKVHELSEASEVIEIKDQLPPLSLEVVTETEKHLWNTKQFNAAKLKRIKRSQKRILVIDDDENIRDLTKAVLDKDFMIITAENGKAATKLYSQNAPDVVLLDINMPNENGLDLLQFFSQHDENAKIIMLSVHNTMDVVKEALAIGAKGYLIKPVNIKKLKEYAQKFA